jgi:VWFA-related protein
MRAIFIAAAATTILAGAPRAQTQAPQPPKFQSSVEVVPVDVSVVDDRGKPIRDLTPTDFNVRIDGNGRRVVTAEWVSLVTAAKPDAAASLPAGYTSNENATGGRLIVIAVDEPNIRFGGARGLLPAASAFVDHLAPTDRIAAVGLGLNSPATPFTADRERVKQTLARMVGQKQTAAMLQYNIALSEAIQITAGDTFTLDSVVTRECRNETSPADRLACRNNVQSEAMQVAHDAQQEGRQTTVALRSLLTALGTIDAPKTLILMSEGFVLDGSSAEAIDLGTLATQARTSVYSLLLDDNLFAASEAKIPIAPTTDRRVRSEGLETLAGAARGAVFNLVGTGGAVFDRIESELTGYYLLGVEADPRDRDGKPHPVRVDVPRRGAIVRARRHFVTAAPAEARQLPPRQAVAAAMASPLPVSALPLRVVTFSLQGPEASKVQVLIHADVGTDFTGPKRMAVGYTIIDKDGRLVDSHGSDARLTPLMSGVPSPLEYVAGASVPPGEYMLKLAIADADRAGSIEHPIHAGLVDGGSVRFSELMVGGPVDPDSVLRPTIGYAIHYGMLHAYVEAYGTTASSVAVKYEVATSEDAPPILSVDVPARPAGDGRALFSHVLQVRALPAGKYLLRAIFTSGGRTLKTMTRAFEVTPPAVLMTSATGVGDETPSADGELFLPVNERSFETPFRRDEAVKEAIVEPFRAKLAAAAKPAFEKGLTQLAAGDYVRAEASFKSTIQPDADSTAGLAYLAVCFAASGHDTEAASAWQTALVDGEELSQIYQWLAEALMRTHDYAEARAILEEAVGKWPSDARFTRPLAMLYATFGKGREAVRTLERYLAEQPDDHDALYLALEWIYHVRSAGAFVYSRADDLKLAQTYAAAYERGGGKQMPLVKQWLGFLENDKR